MDTALVVTALVVAVLCVPSVGGLTAWGLAGGDGSPASPLYGVLAVLVGLGSVYNAVTCYLALWDVASWQWWLMWAAPAAGLVGVVLEGARGGYADQGVRDWLLGFTMQLVLALPVVLLGASGAVS